MSRIEDNPLAFSAHYEFQSRQLVSHLHSLRDRLMELKEEASGLISQQWARSKGTEYNQGFDFSKEVLENIEVELAQVLCYIRSLSAAGRADTNPGETEQDV